MGFVAQHSSRASMFCLQAIFANITFIVIHADLGRSAVRGHCERLECLTRAVPPFPVQPSLRGIAETWETKRGSPDECDIVENSSEMQKAAQGSSGRKNGLSDVADGVDVDAKQGAFGRDAEDSPPPDPHPAARAWRKRSLPEAADGRGGMGGDA